MKGKAQLDYESGKVPLWTYRQLEKEIKKVQVAERSYTIYLAGGISGISRSRIPVTGLMEKVEKNHPWVTLCCSKIFRNLDLLAEYVHYYYLT